jgi:hypothetical protein
LQTYRDRIEALEAHMLDSREPSDIHAVTEIKSELGSLRRHQAAGQGREVTMLPSLSSTRPPPLSSSA